MPQCQRNDDIIFSGQVHASFVASLLQSDIKVALKTAFGSLDGPLSLTDWCKGRNQASDTVTVSDGFSVDCIVSEIKDSSSITLRGESISPPQALSGSSSLLKGTFLLNVTKWVLEGCQ